MDYLIVLGNGMNLNRPLNGCKINVRFCFVQYIKAVNVLRSVKVHWMYQKCSYRSFVNVYLYKALFEFLFVMLNQKLFF